MTLLQSSTVCDVKFRQEEGNHRKFRHIELSISIISELLTGSSFYMTENIASRKMVANHHAQSPDPPTNAEPLWKNSNG